MNAAHYRRPWARRIGWGIVLAAIFGVIIYVVLTLVTGGLLVWVSILAALLVLAGLCHYFIWGQAWSRTAARRGELSQAPAVAMPAHEITLTIDDVERVELIRALEQSTARSETLRELLERLRGFGA